MIGLLGKGDRGGRREIDHEPLCAQVQNQCLESIGLASAAAHNNLLSTIEPRGAHVAVAELLLHRADARAAREPMCGEAVRSVWQPTGREIPAWCTAERIARWMALG